MDRLRRFVDAQDPVDDRVMTLFAAVSDDDTFRDALIRYFGGGADQATLDLLD